MSMNINSLAKAQSCQTINKKFGAFVAISFHICILLKYLSAILFVWGQSLIVLQYN